MSITVEKITMQLGRSARNAGAEGAWAGIPEPATLVDGGLVVDVGGPQNPLNTFQESSVELKSPPRFAGAGPIQCIAIAADSPIESVDLHISGKGGSNTHRIGVGTPFIGTLAEDARIMVTPVKPVPLIYRAPPLAAPVLTGLFAVVGYQRMVRVFDCAIDNTVDGFAATPIVAPFVPVRLNVYRGGVPPIANRRAPYHMSAVWEVDTDAGAPIYPHFFMHVDGRRRIRVRATRDAGGDASLDVYGLNARKNINNTVIGVGELNVSGRNDESSWDELLAPTVIAVKSTALTSETVFDLGGPVSSHPYQVLLARISGVIDGANGTLDITAWDD